MARPTDSNEQLLCSFCGKSQRQVKKLIAGPGVYICDECIDLCNEIIDEELTAPPSFDIEIQAKEIRHAKDVITDILASATGKPKELIHKDIDRDFYMGAGQAKEYGLIDDVLPPRKKGEGEKSSKDR